MRPRLLSNPSSACLSDAVLDVLILTPHRIRNQDKTISHLRSCPHCQTRCVSRAKSIQVPEPYGILQPESWRESFQGNRLSFSHVSACVAAVSILGIAFLAPLFLRHSTTVRPLAQTVEQPKPAPAEDLAKKIDKEKAEHLKKKQRLDNELHKLMMLRAQLHAQEAEMLALQARLKKLERMKKPSTLQSQKIDQQRLSMVQRKQLMEQEKILRMRTHLLEAALNEVRVQADIAARSQKESRISGTSGKE